MKHKFLKSVVATFALVATLAVLPMAPSVEAAECDGMHCLHETLYLDEWDYDYVYLNYSQHIYVYDATYVCPDCGVEEEMHTTEVEDHFDPDGDGMCVCGTFYY